VKPLLGSVTYMCKISSASSQAMWSIKIKPFCPYFSLPLVSEACLGVICFRRQTSSQWLLYSCGCWCPQWLHSSHCQAARSGRQSLAPQHLTAPAQSCVSAVKDGAEDPPCLWCQVQSRGFLRPRDAYAEGRGGKGRGGERMGKRSKVQLRVTLGTGDLLWLM